MSDRALLEAAAKAAGMTGMKWTGSGMAKMIDPSRPESTGSIGPTWNPLTDDGDALRLAVKLQIDVKHYGDHVVAWFDGGYIGTGCIPYDDDPCAATRLAITRAAASIGSGKESAS